MGLDLSPHTRRPGSGARSDMDLAVNKLQQIKIILCCFLTGFFSDVYKIVDFLCAKIKEELHR